MKNDNTIDESFMALAVAEARAALTQKELPFGAVIVKDGQVIAAAHCQESTLKSVLAHAETLAIDAACKKLGGTLTDCALYATNEPCAMCAAALFQAKIPRIIIGASRSDLDWLMRARKITINELAADSGYPIDIKRGLLKELVLELFEPLRKH